MKFGEKIKQLRMERDMSQEELARQTGVSVRTIAGYERDGRYPQKREVYDKLAEVLGVPKREIYNEDEGFVLDSTEQYGSRGRRQAEQLVNDLTGLFAGGELSESDKDAVMIALQKAYFDCKVDNRKYTNKRYMKDVETQGGKSKDGD